MLPAILAALGALAILVRKMPTTPAKLLAKPPVPPQQATMTPARAEVHGNLLRNCVDPQKLERAAALFGHEGLSECAETLLRKAQMIHDMMHGAQSIVERCRTGDQHAMALAKGIGEQARVGNKRAQLSQFLIEEYTKMKPASGPAMPAVPGAPARAGFGWAFPVKLVA